MPTSTGDWIRLLLILALVLVFMSFILALLKRLGGTVAAIVPLLIGIALAVYYLIAPLPVTAYPDGLLFAYPVMQGYRTFLEQIWLWVSGATDRGGRF